VVEHIPNFIDTIIYARSLLKEKGIMIIECPNQSGFTPKIREFLSRFIGWHSNEIGTLYPPGHIHAFSRRSFYQLSKKANLRIKRVITYSPYNHYYFPERQFAFFLKMIVQSLAENIGLAANIAVFLEVK
jgi:hypothetical protein